TPKLASSGPSLPRIASLASAAPTSLAQPSVSASISIGFPLPVSTVALGPSTSFPDIETSVNKTPPADETQEEKEEEEGEDLFTHYQNNPELEAGTEEDGST